MVAMMQAPVAVDPMIHTQAVASFYNGTDKDEVASLKAGRPIYRDIEMIRIQWVGNTKSEFHAPASDRCDRPLVNPEDKSRYYVSWKNHPDFAKAYEAFKAGQAYAVSGTPITELPFLSEANRMELKAINVHTAESLANMDAKQVNKFGLGQWQTQAKAFLQRAAGAAVDAQHAAEKKDLEDRLAEMQRQIEALASGAKPASKAKASEPAAAPSPFDSWSDEDIKLWIKDVDPGEPEPHHKLGHAKLVALADSINARLKAAA